MNEQAYKALDRVRDLLISWRNNELLDQELVTELDEALTNCVDDRDAYKWVKGFITSQDYFE